MQLYKADLHIHTVLSPCGDLDMSPQEIIRLAKERGLDIIGISDHNTTKHAPLAKKCGEQAGVLQVPKLPQRRRHTVWLFSKKRMS